jgi:hypothetical protein
MKTWYLPQKKDNKIIEKICKIRHAEKETMYKVLKYDENYVCDNDEKRGIYRSVVYAEPEGNILSYSPPKGFTWDAFRERYPFHLKDHTATEIIEGTMISLFWDKRIDGWEIATRGSVGGYFRTEYKEKHKKTFRQMFLEALYVEDLTSPVINELPKGDESTRFCYNFILQHPEVRIVLPIERPQIYLVSVYGITETTVTFVPPSMYREWKVFFHHVIQFPKEIECASYEEYESIYGSIHCPTTIKGVMILHKETGDRTAIENPAYADLREIQKNHPDIHYQYLCLLRIGKISDFLIHFPLYKRVFRRFHDQFESFVTNVHESYVSVFIRKENKVIADKYKRFIDRLHFHVYIPSLSKSKMVMRRPEIRKQLLLEFLPNELLYAFHTPLTPKCFGV